jgi:anti-sigma B factor antagonist
VKAEGMKHEVRDGMLSVRVSDAGPDVTVAAAGEMDMANAGTLAAELERVEAEGAESITIDISELEFIDSTGIAILVAAHQRLNADATRLRIVPSRASGVQRVMEVTGLAKELPLAP